MTNGLATRSMALHGIKRPGMQQNSRRIVARLPEYLEPGQVEALIKQAPHAQARLVMLAPEGLISFASSAAASMNCQAVFVKGKNRQPR